MLNPECKHCHKKWHQDSAKYCSWCGKKLIAEPEFKVGDYVFELSDIISKIEEVGNEHFWGSYYNIASNFFNIDKYFIDTGDIERYATPEEIAEYKAALTFHEHGRKPFEVKKGDILLEDSDYKFFVDDPENWGKEDFVSGGYTFAKTAEEVNEWIKGE